jgi:ACGX-repeat protein
MALSNLAAWNLNKTASACGTACGASDKAVGAQASCGASDNLAKAPTACGSACGASDK